MLKPLSGRRILVAEDAPDIQLLIQLYLRNAGAEVDLCSDGTLVLNALANSSYNLILMDMQMPKLDGYQTTRVLREQDCQVPIIALTAHAFEEEKQRCLAIGCDEFLSKPVRQKELVSAINQVLTSRAAANHVEN